MSCAVKDAENISTANKETLVKGKSFIKSIFIKIIVGSFKFIGQFFALLGAGGVAMAGHASLFVAVPTTAGRGSEV